MTIQIPRTAQSRQEVTYAKLIWRVHPDRRFPDAFEGVLLKPGSSIEYSELWPNEKYPARPLLLEFAGSDHTGRGHNRSKQIHVLWRFEPTLGCWVEIARTLSVAAEWILYLKPVALAAIGGPAPPDPEAAARFTGRFLAQFDLEIRELARDDRHQALSFMYEQVAARLVN